MKYYLIALGLAASANAGVVAPPGDNCLRAIRNKSRPGLIDCSSYLRTTFTPATSTFYETATSFVTETATDPQTLTNTVSITVTDTIPATLIATVSTTETITSVIPLHKRQLDIPSDIPAYASPCSGAARYTSACSQLGAFPTVITVAAPSTTSTLSTTVSDTETVSPTVATLQETKTDKTSVTVTDATSTKVVVATDVVVAQCKNLNASPVNYRSVGQLAFAGVIGSVQTSAKSAEECCSQCYKDGNCFMFTWGNFDPSWFDINDWNALPPVYPENRCFIDRIVNGGCARVGAVWTIGGAPAGGVTSAGYGVCRQVDIDL